MPKLSKIAMRTTVPQSQFFSEQLRREGEVQKRHELAKLKFYEKFIALQEKELQKAVNDINGNFIKLDKNVFCSPGLMSYSVPKTKATLRKERRLEKRRRRAQRNRELRKLARKGERSNG